MSIMVTGGKGFIGSRIVRKLVDRGEKVVVLEPKVTEGRLSDIIDKITIAEGDARNLEDISTVIKNHDVHKIAHMVFARAEAESIHREMAVMAMGTYNMYEAARLAGIKRVIFASSVRMHEGVQLKEGEMLTEESSSLSKTIYGATKNLNEIVAHQYNVRHGMSIISIRIAGVYGLGAAVGARGVNLAAVNAALGKPAKLPYPAKEEQCLAYVDDVAEITVRFLELETPKYDVYEVGGIHITYGEMADIVREFIPGAQISFTEEAEMGYSHRVDNSRLKQELGFEHRSPREGYLELINITRQEAGLPPVG